MEPISAFLLATQAAGMITSISGARGQQKMIRLGRELERNQLEVNLQAIRLESAESSLAEMQQLRQTIGMQIATNAAMGRRGSSSTKAGERSIEAFKTDERTRRMNLLAKEASLRGNNLLSGFHTLKSETQLGQSLTKSLLDTIPTTSLFKDLNKQITEGFGLGSSMYGGG